MQVVKAGVRYLQQLQDGMAMFGPWRASTALRGDHYDPRSNRAAPTAKHHAGGLTRTRCSRLAAASSATYQFANRHTGKSPFSTFTRNSGGDPATWTAGLLPQPRPVWLSGFDRRFLRVERSGLHQHRRLSLRMPTGDHHCDIVGLLSGRTDDIRALILSPSGGASECRQTPTAGLGNFASHVCNHAGAPILRKICCRPCEGGARVGVLQLRHFIRRCEEEHLSECNRRRPCDGDVPSHRFAEVSTTVAARSSSLGKRLPA